MKKTAAAILSLLLMTGAVAGMADGAYTPGTYRQSAKGMGGDVVVDVTFDADAMTAIDVVSQNETAGLGDVALTSVAQAMLDAQSADVDGVAGATVSSTALKQAVSQAIAEASGKEQAAAHFVPGAYTSTAQGNKGAVTLETTFSDRSRQSLREPGRLRKGALHRTAAGDPRRAVPRGGYDCGRDGGQQRADFGGASGGRAGWLRRFRADECAGKESAGDDRIYRGRDYRRRGRRGSVRSRSGDG